jgi:hypothetical protein
MPAVGFRLGVRPCALLLAMVVAVPAFAYSAELEWEAPAGCPDAGALRLSVERLLGEPLVAGSTVRASASVTHDNDERFTLALTIVTEGGEGTRFVRTDSCTSALDVAAFGIALALNPDLRVEGPSATTPESEPEPVEPAPAPAPEPEVERKPNVVEPKPLRKAGDEGRTVVGPSRSSRAVWVLAHALGDSSLLPNPAFGLGLAAEARFGKWLRFGLGPELFLPQDERIPSGAGGHFTLWSLKAYACGSIVPSIAVCPLFQFGVLSGEGRGVSPRLDQRSFVSAPGAALLGSYAVSSRTEGRLGLSALFPVNRDVFIVREGPVHRIPAASFEVSLGAATRAF